MEEMVLQMNDLKYMAVFFHVVDAGGFTAASRRLGMAKSAVSRQISVLEKELGVRLLNRSTRKMSLTEAGEIYFQACSQVVSEASEAARTVSGLSMELTGSLRISCPIALGNDYIAPLVKEFLDQHPGLKVELFVSDQIMNMVEEGFDVAIRVGWLADSGLVARKITNSPRLLCASPGYLEKHGKPECPEQLAEHQWVVYTLLPTPNRQILKKQGSQRTVHVNGRFKTNNILTLRSLLIEGAGMGVISDFLIHGDIKQGRLVSMMQDYDFGDAGVYAVYPNRHHKQSKVGLFIDFLIENLQLEAGLSQKTVPG